MPGNLGSKIGQPYALRTASVRSGRADPLLRTPAKQRLVARLAPSPAIMDLGTQLPVI